MKKNTLVLILTFFTASVFAQEKVNFTKNFQQQNQGKYKIEINELKELIHIMIAITKVGKENDDMIQQQGQYYKDVLSYFKPYENEAIVKTFDSLVNASIYNYIFLTGNGITYKLRGNKLVKDEVFEFVANKVADVEITINPITTYKKQIEDFALKSNFNAFYNQQKTYYNQIIADYEKKANLGKQWTWLEKKFHSKINSYVIYCSPLINGLNYTGEFDNNNFKLAYMVLPSLDKYPKLTELQNEILNTRVMFTEIDHHYVNPPSDANAQTINELFKDRTIWVNEKVNGTSSYPNPVKVFNEYMTFGVFLLFCKDHYDEKTFTTTTADVIALMTDRGFPKMKDFTTKLFKVYAENEDKKIEEWYAKFLGEFKSIK
jgi:hypothetical protein